MSSREELAAVIDRYTVAGGLEPCISAIIEAGWTKPKVLGYVVVGRDGELRGDLMYDYKDSAQNTVDRYNKDYKEIGIDCDYRVAQIVEVDQ